MSVPKGKTPLTHFLCIPLVTASSRGRLKASLDRFYIDFCQHVKPNKSDASSVAEKVIRPLGTIHLTLGVMSLDNHERIQGALQMLQGLNLDTIIIDTLGFAEDTSQGFANQQNLLQNATEPSILPNPTPFRIKLEGLMAMHAPSKTSILYISPTDPGNRLEKICESIKHTFQQAGYLTADTRPLLLHATVANTIYASGQRRDGRGHGAKRNEKLTLDAEELIKRYRDVVWAEDVLIESLNICKMGAKPILDSKGKDTGEILYDIVGSKKLR